VLDSGYTNHIMGERMIFTYFEKNECESDEVIASRSAIIAKVKFLVSVKLLSQLNIQYLNFFLSNL
jgi:hypothetical protein